MSTLTEIKALITEATAYVGEAATGATLPYVVIRPLIVDDGVLAINGDALDWDLQFSLYCCASGVEASFNLALSVIGTLQGQRVEGTTLSTSMGYNGAPVEGHYESQVTVQLNRGDIS